MASRRDHQVSEISFIGGVARKLKCLQDWGI
jgi:hypothetical protein